MDRLLVCGGETKTVRDWAVQLVRERGASYGAALGTLRGIAQQCGGNAYGLHWGTP